MRKLIVLVLVLALLFIGANLLAAHVAGDEIASRAKQATGASSASASVGTFPVLYRFLANGSVPEVRVALTYVPVASLDVASIGVVLRGVVIDRGDLFAKREVRVKSIASARATVVVTAAELSSAVGRTVMLPGSGRVEVELASGTVAASVGITAGDVLVVSEAGVPLVRVDLATSPLVPACSMSLDVGAGQVEATCSVSPVPAKVLAAISGAASSG